MNVILVATWYPAVDDPARGRFVADQARALLRTGKARPAVVSFDPLPADAELSVRPDELGTATRLARAAWGREGAPVSTRAYGSQDDVPVLRLPVADGLSLPPGVEGDVRRDALDALLDHVSVDWSNAAGIVHAHTAYPDGYAAARIAERLGWPLVITEHASFVARQLREPAVRRRYVAAVDAAQRFLAVSDSLAAELRAAVPALAGRVEVVPNLIHLEDFALGPETARHGDELLFVGYRKPTKGMEVLLRAFAEVRQARPEATLRLVGRSSNTADEARWHALAGELGISGGITFDPPADRSGVAAALARASVFVHPSPRETFGITTLEALASGIPVVAARSGGISAILEDPALGELVAPNDARALAAAILRTLERRATFEPSRLRAAVEPFSAAAVGDQLVAIYRGLVGPQKHDETPLTWPMPVMPERYLAVSLDSPASAAVFESLPADLRRRAEVVLLPAAMGRGGTTPTGAPGRIRRRLRRIVAEPLIAWRRVWARNPVAARRRRRTRERAVTLVSGSLGATPPSVLCLDATSAWAVEPLVAAGLARPLPSGVLWLADRWWSDQPSSNPSRARISEASRSPMTDQS